MRLSSQNIGKAIREARELKGWTLLELATRVGVNRGTIVVAENNGPARFRTFLDICQALSLRPSTVLSRAEKHQDP